MRDHDKAILAAAFAVFLVGVRLGHGPREMLAASLFGVAFAEFFVWHQYGGDDR